MLVLDVYMNKTAVGTVLRFRQLGGCAWTDVMVHNVFQQPHNAVTARVIVHEDVDLRLSDPTESENIEIKLVGMLI